MRSYLLPWLMVPVLIACSPPPVPVEPIRAVRMLELQSGVSALQSEYAAEIRARTESRLAFRVGGKLVRRPVNVGDVVKAGQVLAQIDASDLKLGQDAARAALSAADTQLALNEAEVKRYKELREQGFISGLVVATVLTLLALPATYAAWFRVKRPVVGHGTPPAS